jgi:hypothetical protein
MHVVDGIDMAPELQIERPSLDEFVAQLTEAAYPIALRHTRGNRWLGLELDLWRVIAQAVLKWDAFRAIVQERSRTRRST